LNRREFLSGLVAAMAIAAFPVELESVIGIPKRTFPKINANYSEYFCTLSGFVKHIQDVFKQVQEIAKLKPNAEEQAEILTDAEKVLKDYLPIAVWFDMQTSFDKILSGEFEIQEDMQRHAVVLR
jgi:hypothetical protein